VQGDALCRQFLLDRTRHVSSLVQMTKTRLLHQARLFRASSGDMQAAAVGSVSRWRR
jgi:hypothetical protein